MLDEAKVVDADGNAVTSKSSKVGETIYFVCADTFVLDGPSQALCGNDGSWDVSEDDLPVCECELDVFGC